MTKKDFDKLADRDNKIPAPYGRKCINCGQEMWSGDDPDNWDYVVTGSKNYIFVHRTCPKAKGGRA